MITPCMTHDLVGDPLPFTLRSPELAIEVKRVRGPLRLEQRVMLARLADAGVVAFVAKSQRDVWALLRSLDWFGPHHAAVDRTKAI
jgi:hypothetical protein